eukprot:ANDGO_04157.mRNA.1 hypothetical protein H696_02069
MQYAFLDGTVNADASKGASRRQYIKLGVLFFVCLTVLGGVFALYFLLDRSGDSRGSSVSQTKAFVLAQLHLYNKTAGLRSYQMQATREYVIRSTLHSHSPYAPSTPSSASPTSSLSVMGALDPNSLQLDQDTLYMLATMSSQAYNEQNANPIVCDQVNQDCAAATDSSGNMLLYTESNVVSLVYQELNLDSADYQNALNGQAIQNFDPTGVIVIAFKGTNPTSFNDLYSDDYIYRCPASQAGFGSAQSTATDSTSYVQSSQDLVSSIVGQFSPTAVVFTGHSLGGTLAMVNYVAQGIQDSVAIPFSAPPSGLVFEYISQPTGDVQGIYEFYTQGDPLGGGTSIVNAQCYPGSVGVYADTTGCSYIGCHSINVLLQNIAAEQVPSYGFPNDNTCLPCGTF